MTVRAVESWTLQPLNGYVHEAGARLVLLMTPAGQVLAQFGFTRAVAAGEITPTHDGSPESAVPVDLEAFGQTIEACLQRLAVARILVG